MGKSALVLFSGGQDSAVSLMWSLLNFSKVYTIGFKYNQRHIIEMECRINFLEHLTEKFPSITKKLREDFVVDLSFISQLSESALTDESAICQPLGELPNTFVPGRNIFFFSAAASSAYAKGVKNLVGGMCETDYSGYPDCRADTIKSLQETLCKGMDFNLKIHTPLMRLTKAETWQKALEMGGRDFVEMVRLETHSCYLGKRDKEYTWGYGCNDCPACVLRREGYKQFLEKYSEL